MNINRSNLILDAMKARDAAYVPYSKFKVGAALLTRDGRTYLGCNIENASYSPTNCAERTAIFKAVSEGYTDFAAIAISGGYDLAPQFCFPCGVCRQVLIEFCDPDTFEIIIAKSENEYQSYLLKELLPFGFSPKNLDTSHE